MCADAACLVLRLEGPLQSWGTSSQYSRRLTDRLPSRSAVAGMLCAALGLDRGSAAEGAFLREFAGLRMLAVAVPRVCDNRQLPVQRLEDYHTVQDTAKADGGLKPCHLTWRQYLLNAAFRVFLSGERPLLERAAAALRDPVWGLWLGRKACIPTAPVFMGLFDNKQAALRACLPQGLAGLTSSRDAEDFNSGTDSIADIPLCFDPSARAFSLRRIILQHGEDSHAP